VTIKILIAMFFSSLSLSLLEAGILFVDNIQLAFPANDLAINDAFLNG